MTLPHRDRNLGFLDVLKSTPKCNNNIIQVSLGYVFLKSKN
jgi:hypothetical protein